MDDYTSVLTLETALLLRPDTAGKVLALLSEGVPVLFDFDNARWKLHGTIGYGSAVRVMALTPAAHAILMCNTTQSNT